MSSTKIAETTLQLLWFNQVNLYKNLSYFHDNQLWDVDEMLKPFCILLKHYCIVIFEYYMIGMQLTRLSVMTTYTWLYNTRK